MALLGFSVTTPPAGGLALVVMVKDWANVAVMAMFLVTLTVAGLVVPVRSPDQPAKTQPLMGTAVRVTLSL